MAAQCRGIHRQYAVGDLPASALHEAHGPIYEMRLYTYQAGEIPAVIEHWSKHIAAREQYSPLIGALYSEFGKLNTWMHIWAYKSFEERLRIRAEARQKGVWPVPGGRTPLRQENKILLPASFSPLQ
jgi:hypothetical protein